MSLKSWKKEFYPKPVHMCSYKKAGEHTELKWTGLSKKNLKKHGGTHDWALINFEDDTLRIDSDTCLWCRIDLSAYSSCTSCPGYIGNNKIKCDSAYHHWKATGDVRPMLKWIRKARKYNRKNDLGD